MRATDPSRRRPRAAPQDEGSDALDLYLAREREIAFEWGAGNSDCMLFLAGWHFVQTGVDFGADWRALYSDEAGALALIERRGGLSAYLGSILGRPSRQPPQRGCKGLVKTERGLSGMICTGGLWVMRHERRGLVYAKANPLEFWN